MKTWFFDEINQEKQGGQRNKGNAWVAANKQSF